MRHALLLAIAACGSSTQPIVDDANVVADAAIDTPLVAAARDRILETYLDWLQAHPGPTTNGLDGAQIASVCTLWTQLQPSAQAVFLTLTARLEGSHLQDDSSALDHVTALYWLTGGTGTTASDPGSCGGAGNRMILSMDATLHDALRTANAQSGGPAAARTISDVVTTSFWRNTHDLGGPHAPFDESDETEGGAPRGQVQYFADPLSTTAPLGRPDLMTLVDPHALEIDQDYDCTHNSNPLCSYTLYGPLCAARPNVTGVEMFAQTYGAVDLTWKPAGC
ncbi:MAG TPA: hypothetical protein VK509_21430 [Polyangiales bacterium]|nr:hypothetical protein [Polyangiales bacterium]